MAREREPKRGIDHGTAVQRSGPPRGRDPGEVLAVHAKGAASFSGERRFASLLEKMKRSTYKDVRLLAQFVRKGKITPRRLTGVCTPHQRRLSRPSSRRGIFALLPFADAPQ